MKNLTKIYFVVLFLGGIINSFAQKITDAQTIDLNGISVTFNILNKESIEVGGKTFDRYKVSATAKNNSGKSINIRLTSYPQFTSNTGVIELNCINATGARLTSKKLELKLKTHNVNANLATYDKNGKSTNRNFIITAGYYFDDGDSIRDNAIFIVPKGELPDVSVRSTF